MKTFIVLTMLLACTACSTVAGIGKDIQSGAEWSKEKMGGSRIEINR
jgi:predicted small secreted protein